MNTQKEIADVVGDMVFRLYMDKEKEKARDSLKVLQNLYECSVKNNNKALSQRIEKHINEKLDILEIGNW
ncbi:hypothetical protein [uncultured Acinetobacter sp.]|uniref:hypothetical protein n=1 Tax=uncultured Acinetobacter sp. TaxID=165433 RepID=UPI00374A1FBF